MTSTFEKNNVTYNAQGDAIYSNTTSTTSTYPTSTYQSSSYPTTSHYTTTGAPSQLQPGTGAVADSENLNDPGAKGKVLRFYNKIETAMRKKFDSSSGPSSRSDPLGGYTVKGPGYYEKKHKFTRRVTTRGTPPSTYASSSSTSTTPSYAQSTSAGSTYTASNTSSGPASYSSAPTSYSSAPASTPQSYTSPSVPVM